MSIEGIVFNAEHEAISDLAKLYAQDFVAPRAAAIDADDAFFFDLLAKAGELGLIGTEVPMEMGGSGGDPLGSLLSTIEIATASPTVAATFGAIRTHLSLLVRFGTEQQKDRWLPGLLDGSIVAALGITEPGAGSDLARSTTRAMRRGDGYVINGAKCFTSLGNIASFIFVLAYTDETAGTRKGMTVFIVEKDTPGLSFGRLESKLGQRGVPLTSETFTDVLVPEENIVGKVGQGLPTILSCLDGTRVDVAAQGLGVSRAALAESARYANERIQFGRPIGDHQAVQWPLADMHVEYEAGFLLAAKAAVKLGRGEPCSVEAAAAKLFCSENAVKHASQALQIFGGYGYIRGNVAERLFRDARVLTIWDGTSEMQRRAIARSILKEFEAAS